MNLIYLDIAGFHFAVREDGPVKAVLQPPYLPFLCPNQEGRSPGEDLTIIQLHAGYPDGMENFKEVFRAREEAPLTGLKLDSLWTIHDDRDRRAIFAADQETGTEVATIAVFDETCRHFDVYYTDLPKDTTGISRDPFPYPLGPLILYYVSVFHGAALIHASGVHLPDGTGMLFTAVSGTGKSTMAGIWEKAGARVINDDRLLLKYKVGDVIMHNTPMPYSDVPKQCDLHKIFLIKQSPENYIKQLKGAAGFTRLFAQFIQHAYNKDHINALMLLAITISGHLKIYECGFKPDQDIVDLILEQTAS